MNIKTLILLVALTGLTAFHAQAQSLPSQDARLIGYLQDAVLTNDNGVAEMEAHGSATGAAFYEGYVSAYQQALDDALDALSLDQLGDAMLFASNTNGLEAVEFSAYPVPYAYLLGRSEAFGNVAGYIEGEAAYAEATARPAARLRRVAR